MQLQSVNFRFTVRIAEKRRIVVAAFVGSEVSCILDPDLHDSAVLRYQLEESFVSTANAAAAVERFLADLELEESV